MFKYIKKIFSNKNLKFIKQDISSVHKYCINGSKTKVYCDEIGLKVEHPDGTIEYSKWEEIVRISIITTDQGPVYDDIFLMLFKKEKGCLIPSESDGYNEVYEKVSNFEGFDFNKYIEAMSSATNNEFLCWQKK
ncbi:MAG: hypothetical protein COA82_12685 [Alkaliphilus sp.]|nr:MAG: hypothetical protein COA82_12685 [Alkaliphilus sp.]